MERIEGSVSQFSDFTKNFFHYGGCGGVNNLLTYMYRENQEDHMKTAEQYRKELKKEFPNRSDDNIEKLIKNRMRMDKYYFDMCGYVPSEKMVNTLSSDAIIV